MATANSLMIRTWTKGLPDKQRIDIIELFDKIEGDRNNMARIVKDLQKQLTAKTSECEKLRECVDQAGSLIINKLHLHENTCSDGPHSGASACDCIVKLKKEWIKRAAVLTEVSRQGGE